MRPLAPVVRRLAAAATLALAVASAVPATVAAECNGPACGPLDQGVEGLGAALLLVILVSFVTVMAVAEARRR